MRAPSPKTAAIAAGCYVAYTIAVAVVFTTIEKPWSIHLISHGVPQLLLLVTTGIVIAAFWGSNPDKKKRLVAFILTVVFMSPMALEGFLISNNLPWALGASWNGIATSLLLINIGYLALLFWPKHQKK